MTLTLHAGNIRDIIGGATYAIQGCLSTSLTLQGVSDVSVTVWESGTGGCLSGTYTFSLDASGLNLSAEWVGISGAVGGSATLVKA